MIMVITIIMIIIIIMIKVKKIKMMLISLILLRPSSSNKVRILDRSFVSKDLILTYLFTRPGSSEQSLIGTLCPP